MRDADSHETAERWGAAGAAAPRVARRRTWMRALLLLLALPGLAWLVWVAIWASRASVPLMMVTWLSVVHLAALAIAVGLPARGGAAHDATGDVLHRLRSAYAARVARLRTLRGALLVEILGNVLWSAGVTIAAGGPFRLGPGFTVALATLWVAWPLERIAIAQRDEAGRLARDGVRPHPHGD